MKDYEYFQGNKAKLFSIFGRSRGGIHYNCLAYINEQCRLSDGYINKEMIANEIEMDYGSKVNPHLELSLLQEAGWIEIFQKMHSINDYIRMTKDGRILFQAIQEIHGEEKDFPYGRYISDIYRRLITVNSLTTATYQDLIVSSYEGVLSLKDSMQNFASSFEDFVKGQKANATKADEVINIMRAVSGGKEFRNYKAIIKDEYNYYKYSAEICSQVEKIKEDETIMKQLAKSCQNFEGITEQEAEEALVYRLNSIKSFFMDDYRTLVEQMKEVENDCYEKIANILSLYASDGTADKSICDLMVMVIHDAQTDGDKLPPEFFQCFRIFDNTIFESKSLKSKRKTPEYKREVFHEAKPLTKEEKLKILIAANGSIHMKTSVSELHEFLEPYIDSSKVISSGDFVIRTEKDYSKVFLLLSHCANESFEYRLVSLTEDIVERNGFEIPLFKVERK